MITATIFLSERKIGKYGHDWKQFFGLLEKCVLYGMDFVIEFHSRQSRFFQRTKGISNIFAIQRTFVLCESFTYPLFTLQKSKATVLYESDFSFKYFAYLLIKGDMSYPARRKDHINALFHCK